MTFGERLRECRRAKGLTQEQLANAIGITDGSIANYENDRNDPRLFNVSCMATALGVSIDYLAGLSNKK